MNVGEKVKMCGKSTRPSWVTNREDKPCELKCHVHFEFLKSNGWIEVELHAQLAIRRLLKGVGR